MNNWSAFPTQGVTEIKLNVKNQQGVVRLSALTSRVTPIFLVKHDKYLTVFQKLDSIAKLGVRNKAVTSNEVKLMPTYFDDALNLEVRDHPPDPRLS